MRHALNLKLRSTQGSALLTTLMLVVIITLSFIFLLSRLGNVNKRRQGVRMQLEIGELRQYVKELTDCETNRQVYQLACSGLLLDMQPGKSRMITLYGVTSGTRILIQAPEGDTYTNIANYSLRASCHCPVDPSTGNPDCTQNPKVSIEWASFSAPGVFAKHPVMDRPMSWAPLISFSIGWEMLLSEGTLCVWN